jgi:hypothetical protein
MGAGRLPEQIVERADAGRQAMLENQTPDQLIEMLKAKPVKRTIVSEENNTRKVLPDHAAKGQSVKAKSKALRSARHEILALRAEIARMKKEHEITNQTRLRQIEILQKELRRLRD